MVAVLVALGLLVGSTDEMELLLLRLLLLINQITKKRFSPAIKRSKMKMMVPKTADKSCSLSVYMLVAMAPLHVSAAVE